MPEAMADERLNELRTAAGGNESLLFLPPVVLELLAEVDRLRALLAAERERVAAWFAPHPAGGRWCRLADHQQGACDCAEIAAAIRGGRPA